MNAPTPRTRAEVGDARRGSDSDEGDWLDLEAERSSQPADELDAEPQDVYPRR